MDSVHSGQSLKTEVYGNAHGGCVVDANEADTERPSAGPAVVEESGDPPTGQEGEGSGSDVDEELEKRIADGEDDVGLPAAEADSLLGLREQQFQDALEKTCPGMKGAKARKAYSCLLYTSPSPRDRG